MQHNQKRKLARRRLGENGYNGKKIEGDNVNKLRGMIADLDFSVNDGRGKLGRFFGARE